MPTTLLLDKEEMTRILERLAKCWNGTGSASASCWWASNAAAPTWPAAWAP